MIKKIFIEDTENTFIQLIRYTFVGGTAFAFDIASLYIFTEFFGIHYLVSAALGFFVGISVNYLLSVAWIFKKHRFQSRASEIIIFAVIGIVGLVLNEVLIWFFTEIAMFYYLISKLFSAVIVYLWNFFVRKYFLYSVKE